MVKHIQYSIYLNEYAVRKSDILDMNSRQNADYQHIDGLWGMDPAR